QESPVPADGLGDHTTKNQSDRRTTGRGEAVNPHPPSLPPRRRIQVDDQPRITAEASAPPTPCRKRPAIRTSALPATPHNNEAAVKSPSPARKTRLLPTRSPIRPASRSNPAHA